VKYVDAGYAIGLSVLFVYAASLIVRRRRLERAVIARRASMPAPRDGAERSGHDSGPR
jgi:hypothetical protein